MIHRFSRAAFVALLALTALACDAQEPNYKRFEDVIYGRKFGTALTLDVFQPTATNNGCAVIYMVSGGWFSSHDGVRPASYQAFLDRGYTVFAVVHGSQPKFTIPEVTQDIHRAIRFVRANAAKWGVNPDKFGISGGSAGGHLSLTLGTQGGPGKADAKDPIDRASSAVQAVACFFPPTDFLNYGKPGEDATGVGILKNFKAAFGPRADADESRKTLGREISPIYFITAKTPPTFILHGDADKLVPYQQAESFVTKAKEAGVTAQLINRPGKEHGWPTMGADMQLFADWFDEHLRGLKAKP